MTTLRNRSRTVSTACSATYRVVADDWTYSPVTVDRTFSFSDAMTDVVTPNYRSRVAAGEIINNPMWKETYGIYLNQHLSYGDKMLRGQYTSGSYAGFGATVTFNGSAAISLPSWPYGLTDWIQQKTGLQSTDYTGELARLRDLAINAAWEKVTLKQADALVSAGEGRETIKYIYGLIRRGYKLATDLDKKYPEGRVRGRTETGSIELQEKRISAQLADDYLALRYALRPLYYEVVSYIEALTSALVEKDWNEGAVRTSEYPGTAWDEQSTDQHSVLRAYLHIVPLVKLSARAGVWYGTCFDGLTEFELIREKYGLYDLSGAIWELTTCSFILGWFADIGRFLSSLSDKRGIQIKSAFVTLRTFATLYATGYAKLQSVPGYIFPSYGLTPEIPLNVLYYGQKVFREPVVGPPLAISSQVNLDLFKVLDMGLILKAKTHRLRDLSLID